MKELDTKATSQRYLQRIVWDREVSLKAAGTVESLLPSLYLTTSGNMLLRSEFTTALNLFRYRQITKLRYWTTSGSTSIQLPVGT